MAIIAHVATNQEVTKFRAVVAMPGESVHRGPIFDTKHEASQSLVKAMRTKSWRKWPVDP